MAKKYKLIIIDDEFFVIKGLRETVDWAALDIEIVAECNNGAQGWEAIQKHKPDLVISDIRMPVYDGLALAKTLAEERFDCAVIIYSGYNDFEYVTQAMEFGVTRYLLKPIENKVLVEKVQEVLEMLEEERKKNRALEQYDMGLPLLKENLLKAVLEGKGGEEAGAKLKLIGIELPKKGTVIECGVLQNGNGAFAEFYRSLLNALNDFHSVGQMYAERFVIVTGLTDTGVLKNYVKERLDALEAGGTCRLSVGISAPFGAGSGLSAAYAEAKKLRENALFPSMNQISTAEEKTSGSRRKKIITDALALIAAEYEKKISVKSAAKKLFVSESNLMHAFKENLGKTFNDCLTEYRMVKAKELLAKDGSRAGEVAGRVGYSDKRYFSNVFKEMFGMTPGEYAESIKKE